MYDGTHYLQCPIQPKHSFMYRFKAEPAGVHWYHAHYTTQRYDGLFGALIVERSEDELRVEFETKIMENSKINQDFAKFAENSKPIPMIIHEIGHLSSGQFTHEFHHQIQVHHTERYRKHDGQQTGAAHFDTTAINGRGRNRKYLDNNVKTPYEIVSYGPGKLVGLINAGGDYGFEVSIEKHLMKVVETDGSKIKPVQVKFLHIFPGETYTVELLPIDDEVDVENGEFFFRVDTKAELTWGDLELFKNKPANLTDEEALAWQSNFYKKVPSQEKTDVSTYAIISYSGVVKPEIVSRDAPSWESRDEDCTENFECISLNCDFKDYSSVVRPNVKCMHVSELEADETESIKHSNSELEFDGAVFPFTFTFQHGAGMNGYRYESPKSPLTLPNPVMTKCTEKALFTKCTAIENYRVIFLNCRFVGEN